MLQTSFSKYLPILLRFPTITFHFRQIHYKKKTMGENVYGEKKISTLEWYNDFSKIPKIPNIPKIPKIPKHKHSQKNRRRKILRDKKVKYFVGYIMAKYQIKDKKFYRNKVEKVYLDKNQCNLNLGGTLAQVLVHDFIEINGIKFAKKYRVIKTL